MLRAVDASRVEELYRDYGGLVYRRCLVLLRNQEEARVGVQEVFVRVMDRLDREVGLSNARAYLYAAATNYCLNFLRDRKRLVDIADHLETMGTDRDDPARGHAARRFIADSLAGLTERERLATWMYWGDGMTQAEIAETLGLSRKTVVNLLGDIEERLHLDRRAQEAQ